MSQRQPYRLNYIVDVLRDLARDTDTELTDALEVLGNGFADRDEEKMRTAFYSAVKAFKANAEALGILNLLEENRFEAAQREAERIEGKRKKKS